VSSKAAFGYFHSLGIRGVRCFGPAQTLELHENDRVSKWTVILGDNGVGKTTLLQCLHALEPVAMGWAPGVPVGTVQRSFYWANWPGSTSRSVHDVLARAGAESREVLAHIAVDTQLGEVPNSSWVTLKMRLDRLNALVGSQCPNLELTMFACGYGASRKSGVDAQASHESDNAITLFDEQATLLNAEKWFLDSDYAAARMNSQAARARSEKIRETLIKLLPDVDDLEVVGLDLQTPDPALRAHTPYGWVRVGDLSLGYRTLMAWVIDFAARMFARYPDSDNPLAEPAVCLVDEIDLHLHPTWQRKLIDFLDQRFPNTQFIVTAHSPLVVQAAEQANIAVLRRHDGDDFVTIHNDLDAVRGWRVDQILTSDLFGLDGSRSPQVNDLLRERAAILGKPRLDAADEQRLTELDAQLDDVPHGDNRADQDAWQLVRRFANSLPKEAGGR
jgi:energy-coupling factor transporter ATP-binding protein EcfA2